MQTARTLGLTIPSALLTRCLPLGITAKSDFVFTQPRPAADIGQIEIPQRSSAVLSFPSEAWETLFSETTRVNHAARRRLGRSRHRAALIHRTAARIIMAQ
jgi:hypothetical protein